uniref:Peptidoglycan DD-metalloendopeptidase family protein n=1 Tax=Conchiformibius kuhniae TaxID=211502 RepID=A0A8T9MUF9_9NEIS|nr:peptidoglycan DD-metalloendopeptidase family protein [Conchiformibius kuhniae]
MAYAADLRGYGNTVIIDHGEGYLSVYTGLSSLSVGAGGTVVAQQTLGTSGTLPGGEQGLYFEIRYRNRPMNPLAWLR